MRGGARAPAVRAVPRRRAVGAVAPDVQTHPTAPAVTLALRRARSATYLACELVNSDGFVANFVACVLALAVDFWWCKNVSGRLLVGLRYWNEIDDAGESRWRFEARDDEGMARVSANEKRLFWTTLYGGAIAWAALLVGAIASFELNYALIPLVALCLAMTNLVGYFKCSKDAQSQLNGFARRQVASALFSGVGSSAS